MLVFSENLHILPSDCALKKILRVAGRYGTAPEQVWCSHGTGMWHVWSGYAKVMEYVEQVGAGPGMRYRHV